MAAAAAAAFSRARDNLQSGRLSDKRFRLPTHPHLFLHKAPNPETETGLPQASPLSERQAKGDVVFALPAIARGPPGACALLPTRLRSRACAQASNSGQGPTSRTIADNGVSPAAGREGKGFTFEQARRARGWMGLLKRKRTLHMFRGTC